MRRKCLVIGAAGLVVGLGIGLFVADLPSNDAGLSETRMRAWERIAKNCGGIYYILVGAGLEYLAPNMKEQTLNHAKDRGASEVQLLILLGIFEGEQLEMEKEGYGPDVVVDEEEKRELIRLAPILRDNCAGKDMVFPK